jgi:hypothetical protein
LCLFSFEHFVTLPIFDVDTGRLTSLWYAAPAFRINHALKRAIQLKWKSEKIDMDSIPVGILVTYGKDDMYCLEVLDVSETTTASQHRICS